jgi:hypothetical protein
MSRNWALIVAACFALTAVAAVVHISDVAFGTGIVVTGVAIMAGLSEKP